MVIGIDYHGTISKHERLFKRFCSALKAQGIPIYIISALKNPVSLKTRQEVLKCKVPNDGVELVYFSDYTDIPRLKLEACKRLGITMMYDDMPAVCEELAGHGIVTCLIK